MLFETFYPDTWVDSTYQIDFDELYKKGYRGLIFDIDNTLVPHGEPADERAKALFAHLKELGFSCCLLSNNQLERVQMFNRDVQVHYIEDAHKPSRKNYLKAMELMGTDLSDTVFIGDQLFTDVIDGYYNSSMIYSKNVGYAKIHTADYYWLSTEIVPAE